MEQGAITEYIDVAQIVLYLFWGFLAALVFYLRREDKREGYPLESERSGFVTVQGFPTIPGPKIFHLADGSQVMRPTHDGGADRREIRATPAAFWHGAPLVPIGDPMTSGVGPSSFAERTDVPDGTFRGLPRLVPLRSATGFHLEPTDPDPRGMEVIGADGVVGGQVRDVWVDQAECIIRYLEVEVGDKAKKRNVLLPIALARIGGKARRVTVKSILAEQFARVPAHRRPDVVTRLEEDRICAFYAGGNLYATPARAEPLL
jgi:photosynthetic reaction center H subunit